MASNLEYWKNKTSDSYIRQQQGRREGAGNLYQQQEDWLRGLFAELSRRDGKRVYRILDFGCGFGRIAHLASEFDAIEYYGFDISEKMIEGLLANPPTRFESDVAKRVRIADRIEQAYPGQEKFDIILTVSVLIHNQPLAAREIVAAMLDRVAPDGMVVLIENLHTAVSVLQNFWHGGCWCHAFARYFDGRADVEIIDNFGGHQAIYIARVLASPPASRFTYRASIGDTAELLDFQQVLFKGLDRAAANADNLITEWSSAGQDHAALVGRVHDLEEQLAHASTNVMASRFAERQALLQDLAVAVNRTKSRFDGTVVERCGERERPSSEQVEWNALRDTRYSHKIPGFEKVLHIFHKDWLGIRAATGSLPGAKLAIPADVDFDRTQILDIHDAIVKNGFERIVIHGVSKNAIALVEFLARRGFGKMVYAVKHGAPALWTSTPERRSAFALIDLLRSSKLRRVHFMKPGFRFPVDGLFQPLLFNFSPKLPERFSIRRRRELIEPAAFAPGWNLSHKNLYTSILAAAIAAPLRSIWVYGMHGDKLELPSPLSQKLIHQVYSNRESTFELMARASICMNVSLVDCHPMVNVEAQAIGCPCLRGDLHLDALEDHPYVALTKVGDVTSVAEIVEKIDRVLSVPSTEIEAMVRDYQTRSDEVARARYLEFLEL
jgi:SAM-dependent methyltransferase